MIRSLRSLRRAARRDDGASTLEFVLIVPVLFGFIVNSCEAGLVMTRGAFLDWGLNSAVRELRLGAITESSEFVDAVCSHVWVLGEEGECKRRLQLEVVVFDRANPAGAMNPNLCLPTGDDELPPPASFTPGNPEDGEITIVRVCASIPAYTPGFGLGAALARTDDGEYFITATSAYTAEPT